MCGRHRTANSYPVGPRLSFRYEHGFVRHRWESHWFAGTAESLMGEGEGETEKREIDLNWARRNEMNSPGREGRKGCPSRGRER